MATIPSLLRRVLWIGLFLLAVTIVVTPLVFQFVASGLPPLETEFDLEAQLRQYVEGERISHQTGQATPLHTMRFQRPDFTRLPKELVALFLSRLGCPTYFQTPREVGFAWNWRLLNALLTGKQPDGDGWCERSLALALAQAVGVKGPMAETVAAYKIHTFMQKDQLVSYYLETLRFDRGVVGVNAAAQDLFGKPVHQLELNELGELMLAFDYYEDIKTCHNAGLIRKNRDYLLQVLMTQGLVPEDRARAAQAAMVACQR